jgi:release factor glutamine methyltransferase
LPEATFVLTVRDAVTGATELLERAGCDTPRLDAELLVAETLGVGRERLILDPERQIDELGTLGGMVSRRCGREPIAYILGRKDFRRITLSVDPRVLIPRPETELLVEVGLTLPQGARVVDVGTGSGAVALALKDERPDLEIWATEVNGEALGVARENAAALGLEVRFVQGDLLAGVPARIDAVLANLPYVASGSVLPPEISRFEPASALFAGRDGLDVIRRLLGQVAHVPLVGLEVGFDQADQVQKLLQDAGFSAVEVWPDLAGHGRVVLARRT